MNRITPLFLFILFYGMTLSSLPAQITAEQQSAPTEDSLSVLQLDEYQPSSLSPGWTVYKIEGNSLLWQPEHKLEYSLKRLPGVLSMNNELFIRGSLAGEIGYFLDGISITNPFNNSSGIPLILESIESIDLHTGAYGAQLGGANGGLAHITMRKGSDALTGGVDVQTDDFASPGENFLGAGSNGYRRVVGTVQGSVAGVRFFAAAQHRYLRNRQPMFLEPFRFDNLTTDGFGSWPEDTPLPGPIEFKRNYLYNNWSMENAVQGNLLYSIEPFEIRAFGNYSFEEHPEENNWSSALYNYFRKRKMMNETRTLFGALQVSHKLSESASYTVTFSAYNRFNEILDPDFGNEWILYHDSVASREKGYVMPDGTDGFQSRFLGPPPYSIINNFEIAHPLTPNNYYAKNSQSSYSLAAEVTTEILPFWKVSGGGKIDWWTMRMYRISDISAYATYFQQPPPSLTESEKRVAAFREGSIAAYGYDYKGVETDNKLEPPRKPQFLSLFLDNEYVIDAFTLRLGGRYERFATGTLVGSSTIYYEPSTDPPLEQKPVGLLLPRVSIAFRPSSQHHFYAAFGEYAQLSELENFLRGSLYIQGASFQSIIASGDFRMEPLRTAQYEVGGASMVLEGLSFSARLYYKSHVNQPGTVRVFNEQGNAIFTAIAILKEEAIARGLELTTRVTLIHNASFAAHYAFSDWRIPRLSGDTNLRPGQRIVASFDYHSTVNDPYSQGGIFSGVGFTILFTAESGLPYTKVAEPENLGQATAWNIGVRPLIDPRTRNPVEPLNSSKKPWIYYVDLKISANLMIGPVQTEFYAAMLNILNTKNILDVYPTTGSADNDGWLDSQFSESFRNNVPGYEAFYRAINLKNHWAFSETTGLDMYGMPRQLRIGMKVSI